MIKLHDIKRASLLRDPAEPKMALLVLSYETGNYSPQIVKFRVVRIKTGEIHEIYWSQEDLNITYKHWELFHGE